MRYAGVRLVTPQTDLLYTECLDELKDIFQYKVCYAEFPIVISSNEIDLGFTKINSKNLRQNLDGCDKIIIFVATVGAEIDRLINRYSRTAPAKALMLQAIGSERIESLCDLFCKETGFALCKPRFSPGYGDLDLNIQNDIFRVLDCKKRIGAALNDSLIISPSKSVSAIIGIQTKQ